MVEELIKKLLEAGVHFGHQTKRWSPKMKRFIFGQRSGIYIIDLEKTVECLNRARDFVLDITAQGGRILFIGTKKQSQMIIEEEAKNYLTPTLKPIQGELISFTQRIHELAKDIESIDIDRLHYFRNKYQLWYEGTELQG